MVGCGVGCGVLIVFVLCLDRYCLWCVYVFKVLLVVCLFYVVRGCIILVFGLVSLVECIVLVMLIFVLGFSGSSGGCIVVCLRMFCVMSVCLSVMVFFMCELW